MSITIPKITHGDTRREVRNFVTQISTGYPHLSKTLHGKILAVIAFRRLKTYVDLRSSLLDETAGITDVELQFAINEIMAKGILVHSDVTGEYSLTNDLEWFSKCEFNRKHFNSYCGVGLINRSTFLLYQSLRTDYGLSLSTIRTKLEISGYTFTPRTMQRSLAVLKKAGLVTTIGKNKYRTVQRVLTDSETLTVMLRSLQ